MVKMDEEGLKSILVSLSAKYKKNLNLRSKYKNMPEKFAESEADLDAELKNVQMMAAHPELLMLFVAQRGVDLMMDILSHENPDICINVINIFNELTEDDIVLADKDNIQFIDYLISKNVPLLLIEMIGRLNTGRNEDMEALYNIMSTLENISDYKPEMCVFYYAQPKLMKWLLSNISSEEEELTDVRLCACEVFSVIVQGSKEAQQNVAKSGELMEVMTEINKRCSGQSEYNEDYVGNLFNIICNCLLIPENKDLFRDYEGLELMLKLMKCGIKNRRCALRALDYALMNNQKNCKRFIGSLGLSYVLSMYMKKVSLHSLYLFRDTTKLRSRTKKNYQRKI